MVRYPKTKNAIVDFGKIGSFGLVSERDINTASLHKTSELSSVVWPEMTHPMNNLGQNTLKRSYRRPQGPCKTKWSSASVWRPCAQREALAT
jgi:hypothetical protein